MKKVLIGISIFLVVILFVFIIEKIKMMASSKDTNYKEVKYQERLIIYHLWQTEKLPKMVKKQL